MSDLNLRRLQSFSVVAEELHFGRAAERLHIAQPALSQQIQQLESELETVLFERTTRRVSLTPAGEQLLGQVRRLLVAASDVDRAAREIRGGERGLLRLGFVDSTAYELVPRFLRALRLARPHVEFELHTMSSDEQYEALRSGRIDLGLARTAGAAEGLLTREIGSERFLLAVGRDHPLAEKSSVGLADLEGESFIGFDVSVSPTLHAEQRLMLAEAGVHLELTMQATEYTTILGLVSAGAGIAIVPSSVRTFQPPGLAFLEIRDKNATVDLILLSRPDEALVIVHAAIDVLVDVVAPEGN